MFAKINHFFAVRLKGFRTFWAAFAVAAEPILEAAITNQLDFDALGRQLAIAALIVVLRLITTTPAGKNS